MSQTVKSGVEWLVGQGDDADNIDTYSEFAKDVML